MIRLCFVILLLMGWSSPVLGQGVSQLPKTSAQQTGDNEVLKEIARRDQHARTAVSMKTPPGGEETDEDRRKLVHGIIDRNELHTGLDYANAALIFQHGLTPDDYLLAHALAVIGASKGNRLALWLTAATLDRYLQSMKQPQIYGTQFTRKPGSPFIPAPENAALLTDRIRQETDVPTSGEQEEQLNRMNKQLQSETAKP